MPVLGKKYRAAAAKVEAGKVYAIDQAVTLVKQTSYAKFDCTVDVAVRLGVEIGDVDLAVGDGRCAHERIAKIFLPDQLAGLGVEED